MVLFFSISYNNLKHYVQFLLSFLLILNHILHHLFVNFKTAYRYISTLHYSLFYLTINNLPNKQSHTTNWTIWPYRQCSKKLDCIVELRVYEHVMSSVSEMNDTPTGSGLAFDAVVVESLDTHDRRPSFQSSTVHKVNAQSGGHRRLRPPVVSAGLAAHRPADTRDVRPYRTLVRWYNDAGHDHRWPEHRHAAVFDNTHHSDVHRPLKIGATYARTAQLRRA